MPENAKKTPRKRQENPNIITAAENAKKIASRKCQENAKKTPNLFARRNATLIAVSLFNYNII